MKPSAAHASSSPLRVAVVGYGLAGRVLHGPLIRAATDLVLVAAVTNNPQRVAQARGDGLEVRPDLDALLSEPPGGALDIIVIASTNEVHAEQAQAALNADLSVVVDKPMALTVAQASALAALADVSNGVLTVFQNRRWDSDQLTLRSLMANGRLGTVLRHESRFERWRPQLDVNKWRERLPAEAGGGQLLDLGSHLIDQSIQLFGPVTSVSAQVETVRGGSDDFVFVDLRHAPAVRHDRCVHSHLSMGAVFAAAGPRRRVLGTEAAFVVDPLDHQEAQLRGGLPASDAAFGVEPEAAWGALCNGDQRMPVRPESGAWASFYPAVARAVRGLAAVPVDPWDAVDVLRVIEAIRVSATTGTTVEVGSARSR